MSKTDMDHSHESFVNCGQQFYIVSKELLDELYLSKQFLGINISDSIIEQLRKLHAWSEAHAEFHCALTVIHNGSAKKFWIPMLFFQSQVGLIRVNIENVKCDNCAWSGYIATPTSPYLFDLLSDRIEKNAESRKVSLCFLSSLQFEAKSECGVGIRSVR